jgi:hypothetical protein
MKGLKSLEVIHDRLRRCYQTAFKVKRHHYDVFASIECDGYCVRAGDESGGKVVADKIATHAQAELIADLLSFAAALCGRFKEPTRDLLHK